MNEPSDRDVQRVSFVLRQFLEPWNLSLNPENLELMSYCALKYGLDPGVDWAALPQLVLNEIAQDKSRNDGMHEAMRRSVEGAEGSDT